MPGLALWLTLAQPLSPLPQDLGGVLARIDAGYPKLAALREEIASATGKAREKRGAFDPVLLLGYDAQRYNPPSYPGKAEEFSALSGSVQWATSSGLTYVAGSRLNGGKPKSPLNATGSLGEHYVGVRLPLLRDLGVNEKSVALRQSSLAVALAERGVDAFRLAVLRDGAMAYWDWAAAGARRRIADELLTNAQVRERAVRRRFEAGDDREMSVVEARAETERRAGAAAKAGRDFDKASLKLGLYLGESPGEPPPLPEPSPSALDVATAMERATARRPEVQTLLLARDVARLDRDLAGNARRPTLDLAVTASVDAGEKGIGPSPRLGIVYSIPLRQNGADGRIADADAKLRKIEIERAFLATSIRTEVADAASALRAGQERLGAAREEFALSRRLESMERRAFDLGEGTLFLLNQRERAAAEAAARLVDVLAEVHQALAALRAASADL